MGSLADIGGALGGGIAGMFGNDGSGDAEKFYKDLVAKYGALNPNLQSQQADSNGAGSSGQGDVLKELQSTYRNGGLDPIAKEQLAEANTSTERTAQSLDQGIQQRAQAQGQGNSGVTAALQEQAGQGAAERGAAAGRGAAATGYANRMGALGAAGNLSSNMRGADDAISKFNASMRMGAQQGSFDNSMRQLGGEGGAYGAAYGAQKEGHANSVDNWAGVGQGVGGLGDYLDKNKNMFGMAS